MAKGFTINETDFDDLFEPTRAGYSSVTFTGLSPECTYMARTGDATNPNADGYYNYDGTPYDAHPLGYKVPKSLSYSGTWGTQNEGSAVNTSGITFTVTYQDGTTASVTPSVSPSSWATGSGSQTATFSYTYHGVTVSTTKTCNMTYSITVSSGGNGSCYGSTTYVYSSSSQTKGLTYSPNSGYAFNYWSVSGGSASASGTILTINANSRGNITVTGYFIKLNRVGGIVFYIASSSNSYTFYDSNGNVVSTPSVGSDYTNYYYTKSGSSSDKFYIFYVGQGSGVSWGYTNTTTGATSQSIGAGKTNTSTILSKGNPGSGTIFKWLKDKNSANTNGCNDWYVGSKGELEALRTSGIKVSGYTMSEWFSYYFIWSSSEYNKSNAWIFENERWTADSKSENEGVYSTFIIRSF